MPEETFRFKQFNIAQDESVHRVGTDGVLLGAWVEIQNAGRILDVGTGTGLIAIMLAQRSSANTQITALESDSHAHSLTKKNVKESPYSDRIEVAHRRLQDFETQKQFDLIVSNPPFFNNSLKPPTEPRTKQRHSGGLSYEDILTAVTKLLTPSGRLAIILPVTEGSLFNEQAQNFGLYVHRYWAVFSKPGKRQERSLYEFSYRKRKIDESSLLITDHDGSWTEQYKSLTEDFYLNF